jgi:hypothetical protein
VIVTVCDVGELLPETGLKMGVATVGFPLLDADVPVELLQPVKERTKARRKIRLTFSKFFIVFLLHTLSA